MTLDPNRHAKRSLQRFLMASYLYYHEITSIMDDTEYDKLARYLLDNWDAWQDHQHAYLVTKDDLRAGTLYAIGRDDYPQMVVQASQLWARKHFMETEVDNK